ncbi:unnamed protein product [Cunninghamella blakesleeana]
MEDPGLDRFTVADIIISVEEAFQMITTEEMTENHSCMFKMASESHIAEILKRIIREQVENDSLQINDNSTWDDIGFDSLDLVDFAMAVEEEFQVDIPDEEAENLKTFRATVEYIKSHMH